VAALLSATDLFIASSAQETFGLSVLEALANGAPALYTTCPALIGLDAGGRARQVPGTVEGMREAIAAELALGHRERETVPAVEEAYGIKAVTGRIDDLYESLAEKSKRRRPAAVAAGPAPAVPAPAASAVPSASEGAGAR
jgi:glycosyltransferase involved in cell wall biosynthesis